MGVPLGAPAPAVWAMRDGSEIMNRTKQRLNNVLITIPPPYLIWVRRRRRRGGQTGRLFDFAELTTPALRASPPLRGGEYLHATHIYFYFVAPAFGLPCLRLV